MKHDNELFDVEKRFASCEKQDRKFVDQNVVTTQRATTASQTARRVLNHLRWHDAKAALETCNRLLELTTGNQRINWRFFIHSVETHLENVK